MKIWRVTYSLKARVRILLIFCIILPLILIWALISSRMYSLYKQNTDTMIENDMKKTQISLNMIMDNMLYVSQQLINDKNIGRDLYSYFDKSDYFKGYKMLKYLNTQIVTYEVSNPNVGNITYFYLDKDGNPHKLNDSLARERLPDEAMNLCTKNNLRYYGPHKTASVASDYLVISMIRPIKIKGYPDVYIYMESGYKQFNDLFTKTVSMLDGVYTITSESSELLFSSNEKIIPLSFVDSPTNIETLISNKEFLSYNVTDTNNWSLQILVPNKAYQNYMNNLTYGFLMITLGSIAFELVISFFIWNSINRPLKKFEQNLENLTAQDIQGSIERIHVKEFDKNFEYFSNMKHRIVELVESAKQQEKEKSRIEIKQLLNKINPHFIYNTLDTLKWYAAKQQYTVVENFVSSLNKLLFYNMEKEQLTTLISELEAINNYITLQKLKYELEYSCKINIPEPMLNTQLPRFILQPLVENAIFHGIAGNGSIKIQVDLTKNGKILIQVINNGPPMEGEKIQSILKSSKDLSSNGIGIQYVVRMLENKFPGDYEFNIKRTDGNENAVEIIVPFNKGDFYVKSIDS